MAFWKRKSDKELQAELTKLRSKEKARVERKKLKTGIRKLKYGKYVEGAKTFGKGTVAVAKGASQVFDELIPAQKPSKRKKGKRKDDFLDFDIGF